MDKRFLKNEDLLLNYYVACELDCKTVGFFLKISKEIGKAWRRSLTRAYLNTEKYGLFCSLPASKFSLDTRTNALLVRKLIKRCFTYSANSKSQIQLKLRICQEKEQIKTAQKIVVDKKLLETNHLCEEIINSKRQVKGELGHVLQIRVSRLA